ncbi:MAG: hypothetical protein HRT38_13255 [Alteromonadaceae bacterium]|nr:hypothetical protein [Alteromonadaceae bacterium]
MDDSNINKALRDRRHLIDNQASLWAQLTINQAHAANSLTQFGYDLAFLRNQNTIKTAIMTSGYNFATVDIEGSIDTSPNISIR